MGLLQDGQVKEFPQVHQWCFPGFSLAVYNHDHLEAFAGIIQTSKALQTNEELFRAITGRNNDRKKGPFPPPRAAHLRHHFPPFFSLIRLAPSHKKPEKFAACDTISSKEIKNDRPPHFSLKGYRDRFE